MRHLTLVAVLAVLLSAATAAAHGAPPPARYETRVLHDDNDDCGGHGASDNCRGTHDLLAFHIREAYDPALGHVLIFTLLADKGTPGGEALTDTFQYTAKGSTRDIVFRTTDDATFTVQGASKVVGPQPLRTADGTADGTRFTVEAWFQRADLGLSVGDRLSGFTVTARKGDMRGDIMPGGYVTALGTTADGDQQTRYQRTFVDLRGPTQYVGVAHPASATVETGQSAFITLQVTNKLDDMAQTVSYRTEDTQHVDAGFHAIGTAGGDYPDTMQDTMAKGDTQDIHLVLTGLQPGSGNIAFTLTTERGGLATGQLAYTVVAAGSTATDGGPTDTATGEQGSPALPTVLAVALLALLAARRR